MQSQRFDSFEQNHISIDTKFYCIAAKWFAKKWHLWCRFCFVCWLCVALLLHSAHTRIANSRISTWNRNGDKRRSDRATNFWRFSAFLFSITLCSFQLPHTCTNHEYNFRYYFKVVVLFLFEFCERKRQRMRSHRRSHFFPDGREKKLTRNIRKFCALEILWFRCIETTTKMIYSGNVRNAYSCDGPHLHVVFRFNISFFVAFHLTAHFISTKNCSFSVRLLVDRRSLHLPPSLLPLFISTRSSEVFSFRLNVFLSSFALSFGRDAKESFAVARIFI